MKPDKCAAKATAEAMRAAGKRIPLADGKQAKAYDNVVKRLLNGEVAARMTHEEWHAADPKGELQDILRAVSQLANG